MNTARLISRSGVMLGVALAASSFFAGSSEAALTGTVTIAGTTDTMVSGVVGSIQYTFHHENALVKTFPFSSGLITPNIDTKTTGWDEETGEMVSMYSPRTFVHPTVLGQLPYYTQSGKKVTFTDVELLQKAGTTDTYILISDLVLNFGVRTINVSGGAPVTGLLTFTVDKDTPFTLLYNPAVGYQFNAAGTSGHWSSVAGSDSTIMLQLQNQVNITMDRHGQYQYVLTTAVPEPSTYLAGLGSMGLLGLFFFRQRK